MQAEGAQRGEAARRRSAGFIPAGNRGLHRHVPVLATLGVATAILSAHVAHATVVRSLSLLEKTKVSPLVVHVETERVESEWEIPGGSIRTLISVRVIEVLKGAAKKGDVLVLRQVGGKIGELEHAIPGMSKFEPGEESILFLEPLGPYVVEIGVGIAKYEVSGSDAGRVVTHDPKVAVARQVPGSPMVIEPAARMTPEPIETFLERVRNYVRNNPAEPGMPQPKLKLRPALSPPIETTR